MIITLKDKPLKIFDHIDTKCIWLQGYNDDGVYAYGALKFSDEIGSMHLEMVRWSLSVIKTMKKDWETILDICEGFKCKRLTTANPCCDDRRWAKLIKMFGFPEPKIIAVSEIML